VKPARTALKSDTKARVAHQTTTGLAVPADGQPSARAPRLSRLRQLLRLCSWASLTTILAATVVLWFVSEQTWWGTALTFLPRHAFLAMPAVLLVASLLVYRRMIFVNLAAVLVAAIPLMGARIPLTLPAEDGDGLRVVSCNVQRYEPDFDLVLREITAHQPDVVALQEALWTDERLGRTFPGWYTIQEDEYWIGSRYPLKRIGVCHSKSFDRISGLSVEIETPRGPIRLHNLHLTTARFGFAELSFRSVLDGKGPAFVEKYTNWRRDEALECRAEVDRHGAKLPQLIVGDFNTPTVSEIYDTAWHGFTNAFEVAGWGFGYTAPCTTHRHWFNFVPWVRIDHILVDDHWTVAACGIGSGNGSDHRLIWSLVKPR
jgi:endonuclease/exonuclease/phosphatase (EEP) superfamily protein YafD